MKRITDCTRLMAALLLLASTQPALAQGFLEIPSTIDGYPTNVGLLILGHSTSAQGQYPTKLAAALNDTTIPHGGRSYQVFRAITGSDGGMLWSRLATAPADLQYDRITASATVGEAGQVQWCEDATGVRWSCRRAKAEEILTGTFPIPASGSCADPSVANGCRAAPTMACRYYDRTLPLEDNPVTQALTPHACWQRMDSRIALVQDTSNRSWPIDDFNEDGVVDTLDLWPADRINQTRALPCGGTSGVVAGFVDVDCDQALTAADAAHTTYASWLRELADGLIDDAYPDPVDFVIVSQKPTEMGQCQLYPAGEVPTCVSNPHALRSPSQIAATPGRPFDHYYLPTVYWEYRAVEVFQSDLPHDSQIHPLTPAAARTLWDRSRTCYAEGLEASSWTIPMQVPGRPGAVAADDSEADGGGAPDADTVGCMVSDHVHHNDNGGWMMADIWYRGLAPLLWSGVFRDGFESGDLGAWSTSTPRTAGW